MADFQWPAKTRDMIVPLMDSRVWNDFRFRDDDVIVATYGKSGTTWMQQIVSQLLFDGEEYLDVMQIAPWLESKIAPQEQVLESLEAQQHRRSIKTHLPADALVYSPSAKYIYVARDGRDVCWSLYNHNMNMNDEMLSILNEGAAPGTPPLERPSKSIVDYFKDWLEKDGYPFWSFWDHIRSWWSIRHLPNLLMVHYADLKADLPGEMRRVAEFLDIRVGHARWPTIVEHCTFDYMRRHGSVNLPRIDKMFVGGATSFIYKGTNGRWRDELSPQDLERYETIAQQQLGAECAAWLAYGRLHPDPESAMN